jgi:hypothetical protein
LSATGAGTTPPANKANVRNVITGIELNKGVSGSSPGQITLTFAGSFGSTSSVEQFTSVQLSPQKVDLSTVQSEFSDAEIVLCSVGNPQGLDQISFMSYSTEEGDGLKATNFLKQFQLEPEVLSSVLMFPDITDDINSHNDQLADSSYRTRTDRVDNTDQNITFHKPLHDKTVAEGLSNMGLPYKNYRHSSLSTKETTYSNAKANGKRLYSIFDSHPPTQQEKLYQVNIEGATGDGVEKYVLFKQIPKQLVY